MDPLNKQHIIILTVVVIIAIVLLCSNSFLEKFNFTPYQSSERLDKYYQGSTIGVEDMLVDNMTCHPKCCGNQWPVPFDGLTATEVETCIANRGNNSSFVRTNYTCGNGLNGVGCPCIGEKPYIFLANRGENAHSLDSVEPSFIIKNDTEKIISDGYESPLQALEAKRSMFASQRKVNDTLLQRAPTGLDDVMSYGSPIGHKHSQFDNEF